MSTDDIDDTLDDAKDAWQADSPSGDRASIPEEQLLRRVKAEADAFDERIRRRDRREMIAGAIVVLFFAAMLLENVLWWYLAPMMGGLGLVVLGDEGLSWFTLGYGAAVGVFCAVVYVLNQRTVRRSLRPRRKKWTRLLRQLDESPSGR